MIWILILLGIGLAVAAAPTAKPSGLQISEDCTAVIVVDARAAVLYAIEVMRAKGWMEPTAEKAQAVERLLAMIWAAFPQCAGKIPATLDGVPWDDYIDAGWAAALPTEPGIEAGTGATSMFEAVRLGPPRVFESVTVEPKAFEGVTMNPNAGGNWEPPKE